MQSTLLRHAVAAPDFGRFEQLDPASQSRALKSALSEATVAVARVLDRLPAMDQFASREQAILAATNEIARQLIAADLQRTADSFPDEVTVKGKRYRRHAAGTVAYHTLVGDVHVRRDCYRLVGVHNGPTIIPLELASGIVLSASPALAYSVAQGIADMNSRRYVETMQSAGRRPPSRSTVNRLANGIGGAAKQDVEMIEPIIRETEGLPEAAHGIVVGMDRTTVAMAEEIPPDRPQRHRRRRTKPYVRKPPHPFEVKYRQPFVGTVTVVDKNGDTLRALRFGATKEEGPDELVRRMMAEVKHLRDQREFPVAILQDGAEQLWKEMWDGLRSVGIKRWAQAIDWYHLVEHVNAIFDAVSIPNRLRIRERFIARLDKSDTAVRDLCRFLWNRFFGTPVWKKIESHHNYLEMAHLCGQTKYKTLRQRGFPIGSGVTEGTCKSLIKKRFKGGGERWQQDGFTAILTLRALRLSERLPAFWSVFRNRYTAIIEC